MGKLLHQNGLPFLIVRHILLIILLCCTTIGWAKNDSTAIFQGCSGGMMLHAGYLFGQPVAALPSGDCVSPQGLTYGLGGSMRVNLMKHLRIGCEGFSSTMKSEVTDQRNYLQKGSYIRTGWGGVIADACWRLEKVWPFIGGSVGGGAMRTLSIVDGNQDDWLEEGSAILHKQGFGYVNPYVGIDYCITKRIHATFRLDWMLAFANKQLVLPTGPRLYVGIMFCH